MLVAWRNEVAEDCLAVLDDIAHPRLLSQRRLPAAAVGALAASHDEAAQSLAVLVAETAVLQAAAAGHIDCLANDKKFYTRVKDAVRVDLDQAPVWLLWVAVALAPVAGFFTPFRRTRKNAVGARARCEGSRAKISLNSASGTPHGVRLGTFGP